MHHQIGGSLMLPLDPDRHLLYSLSIVRPDIVDSDTLFQAFLEWARDPGKSLGEILADRGSLNRETQAEIVASARRNVARRAAETQADPRGFVLATFDVDPSSDTHTHLPDTQSLISSTDATHLLSSAAPPTPEGGQASLGGRRFHAVRPLARGGFGLVWLAWDEELRRSVALKELLPGIDQDPG